jgi:hypothetical protein
VSFVKLWTDRRRAPPAFVVLSQIGSQQRVLAMENPMQSPNSRAHVLDELRRMLHDLFVATEQGVAQPRLARAHGYADGYMKAMLQAGIVNQRELLSIVAEERGRVAGPATRLVPLDELPRGSA